MDDSAAFASTTLARRRRLRLGLMGKAVLFVASVTLFASFLPVAFFYSQVSDGIKGQLEAKARAIARGLAHNSNTAVVVGDREKLDKLCKGVLDNEDVVYVAIAGNAGDFLSSNPRKRSDGSTDPDGEEALNELRRRGVKPQTEVSERVLQRGQTYISVVEPVRRDAEESALDMLGGEEAAAGPDEGEPVGSVAVGVTTAIAEETIRETLVSCIVVAALVFVAGLVAAWVGTRYVVRPIVELSRTAEIMASGDLTRRITVQSSDETGALSRAFAKMADSLKNVLSRIDSASGAADDTASAAGTAATEIVRGSGRQADCVTATSSAILEMDSSIKDVARSAERMSSSVVGTTTSLEELGASIRQIDESVSALQSVSADASSSVLQMGANVTEAAESIEDLGAQVERTASSIQEMAASIQNVDQLSSLMRESAEATSSTIVEMARSIREVGASAKVASDVAERAAQDVGEGRAAVASTAEGMVVIRKGFDETRAVIARLGESSERIDEIVGIIDDVADRTNLLSLNAAIIAAEAGEQGRAFAVVAEEIRELAVKTAASTRDIAGLIRHVQGDVRTAVSRMEDNERAVAEGSSLAERAGQVLEKIDGGARRSLEMAQGIERATVHQLEGGARMTREMEKLKIQALQISRATDEQAKGGRSITEAVTEMRDKAVMVKKASSEQRVGGERISQGMEKVTEMIQMIARATREQATNARLITDAASEVEALSLEVGRATSEQAKSSAQVVNSVQVIQEVTDQNTALAQTMGQRLHELSSQMGELRKLVTGLRI